MIQQERNPRKEVKVTMNTNKVIRRFLAGFLTVCLVMPAMPLTTLADNKGKGKKDYKEGLKYEEQQQWDMAAQKFALATQADPGNPEYKVHYLRAMQQASMMYIKRGDTLAEQKDYASAYTAYRTAYNFDQGNEIAKMKMERMLEIQKAEMQGVAPINYNAKTGNVRPTSSIQMASKPRSREDVVQDVKFKDAEFKTVANTLAKSLGLNVVFDDSVKSGDKVTVELTDVTMAKALDIILMQKKYTFEQVDRRTIFIYPDNTQNRPRFEKLMVKPFYLGNISANSARTVLAGMLPAGRQILNFDPGSSGGGGAASNSNVLLVKATPVELQLVQDILSAIDKNKNEVVMDVEIFEVSRDSMLQIGNQIASTTGVGVKAYTTDNDGKVIEDPSKSGMSASLANLGGFGNVLPIAGFAAAPSILGVGGLIGLPPTTLSLLQSKGNSKLLYKTQIHVLDGGSNSVKVGKRVPVRLGSTFPSGGFINNGGNTGQGGVAGAVNGALNGFNGGFGGFGGGIDSIQYQDVGLVIKAQPQITNEGYVEVKMEFETSDVQAGSDPLNPTFTQRSLNTVARIQDNVTSIVAGVNQETKGDSRRGLPVLGMMPIVGRLFTTPQQSASQSDIIITVTPHIVRAAGINQKDYLAMVAGPAQGGVTQSIDEVVNRAQLEEEEERRLIALKEQPGSSFGPGGGANTQAAIPVSDPSGGRGATVRPVANQGNKRVVSDSSLIAPVVPGKPTPGSVAGAPSAPNPAVSVQTEQPAEGDPKPEGQPDGAQDVSQVVEQPAQPVSPASVVPASRPENIERAIAKLMAEERARKAAEPSASKNQSSPQVETSQEQLTPAASRKPVAPAGVKMAAPAPTNGGASSGVTFNLSPKPIQQQTGKLFTVTVDVNSQSQLSGANLALKFDDKKMRIKSVKDAGMLGEQPDLGYDVSGGTLNIRIKNPQNTAVRASGLLVHIEFEAIAAGQAEITFNNNDTKVRMGAALAAASGGSTTVIISNQNVARDKK
jgi:general secretion pathway protein D